MSVAAFFGLRELAPALRDRAVVSERDRMVVELRAKDLDVEASLRQPGARSCTSAVLPRRSAFQRGLVVELSGIEPLTS